jgi:SAM-dependent methyltransferase
MTAGIIRGVNQSPNRSASHPPSPSTAAEWIDRHDTLGPYERVGYVGLGENYNRWIYRLRRRHFRRLARRHGLNASARVLDVGIGSAFYIGLYKELGITGVSGADISPTAVERARAAFPSFRFSVGDISAGLPADIDLGAGFDWVSVMDTLFHIVEDALFAESLRHCARALRPGGRLVVSDNFPARSLPADSHQAFHSLEDYERILAPLGLQLVEVSPVFFVSNGQVGCKSVAYRLMALYWRAFSRTLGKTIRTFRPVGEGLGAIAGCLLTSVDGLLQRQNKWKGYSTKTAVFRRMEA